MLRLESVAVDEAGLKTVNSTFHGRQLPVSLIKHGELPQKDLLYLTGADIVKQIFVWLRFVKSQPIAAIQRYINANIKYRGYHNSFMKSPNDTAIKHFLAINGFKYNKSRDVFFNDYKVAVSSMKQC